MQNSTRLAVEAYINRIAELNGVSADHVTSKFSVTPSIQQKLESKIQESSDFLKAVSFYGVDEQEGEKIGLDVAGPIARTVDTSSQDRQTSDVARLDNHGYRCGCHNAHVFLGNVFYRIYCFAYKKHKQHNKAVCYGRFQRTS